MSNIKGNMMADINNLKKKEGDPTIKPEGNGGFMSFPIENNIRNTDSPNILNPYTIPNKKEEEVVYPNDPIDRLKAKSRRNKYYKVSTYSIEEKLYKKIKDIGEKSDLTVSYLINEIIESAYDPKLKKFKIDIDKKDEKKFSSCSVRIDADICDAIYTTSLKTKKSKSEILSEIINAYFEGKF